MKIISSLSLKISFLALLFLIICSSAVFSQSFNIDWQSCYGGSEWDYAYDILPVSEGYIIAGWTASSNGDISSNNGLSDGWILKINTHGEIIWEKNYGGTKGDNFYRIFSAGQGEFYLVGASNSSDGDISYDPYPDSWDLWVLKIDSTGNIIWEEIFGGNGDETVWTGTTTNDGGLVCLVWTASNDGDVSNYYGYYDAWMIKVNSEGEKQWDFTLGSPGQDVGQAIIQTSDGGFLVGISTILFEGGNITCTPHSIDNTEVVLAKLDANLNIEWNRCYGGSEDDYVQALLELEDGYIFAGNSYSHDGDLNYNWGLSDVWVVKIDFDGNIIWQKNYGGTKSDTSCKLFLNENGDFVVFGITTSNDIDVSGNHSGYGNTYDIWMLRLSSTGELLSQQCFGGADDEFIKLGVIQKSDYNFVIAGQTRYGPSFDVTCTPHNIFPYYNYDFWVFEVKDTTVSVQEQLPATTGITAYPNPARDYVCFEYTGQQKPDANIMIFNSMGSQISYPVLYNSNGKYIWDTRQVQTGVYFYTYTCDGFTGSGKIMINH